MNIHEIKSPGLRKTILPCSIFGPESRIPAKCYHDSNGASVAQILIRKVDERVKTRLQRRAKRNGRSMEAEVREIINNAAAEEGPKRGLGSEIVALFSGRGIGLKKGEEIPEIRGMRMQIPKFEP